MSSIQNCDFGRGGFHDASRAGRPAPHDGEGVENHAVLHDLQLRVEDYRTVDVSVQQVPFQTVERVDDFREVTTTRRVCLFARHAIWFRRLTSICEAEGVKADESVLGKLVETSGGDMRRAITCLQSCSRLKGKDSELRLDDVQEVTGVSERVRR